MPFWVAINQSVRWHLRAGSWSSRDYRSLRLSGDERVHKEFPNCPSSKCSSLCNTFEALLLTFSACKFAFLIIGSILPRSVQHFAHVSGNNNPGLFAFEHYVKFIPIYLILLHWTISILCFWTSSRIHRDQLAFVESIINSFLFPSIEWNSSWSIPFRRIDRH